MAIPPSPGHYTKEELQLEIDEAKAMIQRVESKLAAQRDTLEAKAELAEHKAKDAPKGKDDAKLGDRDKDAKSPGDRDKPAYGLGSSKK